MALDPKLKSEPETLASGDLSARLAMGSQIRVFLSQRLLHVESTSALIPLLTDAEYVHLLLQSQIFELRLNGELKCIFDDSKFSHCLI